MRSGYQRRLQQHAKKNGLKLLKIWNVIEVSDLRVAMLAITEARRTLETTTDPEAFTVSMTNGVAVRVKKLPEFAKRRIVQPD